MDSIRNNETVQAFANGPVAEKARAEAEVTRDEFSNLAAARHTPENQTATGQNLTHYHSFLYTLLSWENPRATAASYVSTVFLIIMARYFPLSRYFFKAIYTILGITVVAELAGKLLLDEGFASRMRPRRYYTIPRETLESLVIDAEELANFFVIEFQRVLFAEDVAVTLSVFTSAFILYWLVRFMPTWGLALLVTTLAYFIPLAYIQNHEIIDEQIAHLKSILSDQAHQLSDMASHHTNKAVEMSQTAFNDYSAKAQDLIGQGKKTAVEKGVVSPQTAETIAPESAINGRGLNGSAPLNGNAAQGTTLTNTTGVYDRDFPSAPRNEPLHALPGLNEPGLDEKPAAFIAN